MSEKVVVESCIVKVDTPKSERYNETKERETSEKKLYKRIQRDGV